MRTPTPQPMKIMMISPYFANGNALCHLQPNTQKALAVNVLMDMYLNRQESKYWVAILIHVSVPWSPLSSVLHTQPSLI
eukprot:4979247-Ditylum_brightwellii.AAC.1